MEGASQLIIPGFKAEPPVEGEPVVRLKLECTIKVTDNWSGETYTHKIPMCTDDPKKVVKHLEQAIKHKRTTAAIEEFVKEREGLKIRGAGSADEDEDN